MPEQFKFPFISEEEKIKEANEKFSKTKGKQEPIDLVLERVGKKERERKAFERAKEEWPK